MTRQDKCLNSHGLISYSALKTFSTCPNLYKETYITKTYKEPHHDYFDYGHVVDEMTTLPFGTTKPTWEVVKRRDKNKSVMQITETMHKNCLATAKVIRENPLYKELLITSNTTQQCVLDEVHQRKGIIDILDMSKELAVKWGLYQGGLISKKELQKHTQGEQVRIVDIKTTADIKKMPIDNWTNQLAFYRMIIREIMGIDAECYIIAGDKTGDIKQAQDIFFKKETLDYAEDKIKQIEKFFLKSKKDDYYPSAKELYGYGQKCFKCSSCSVRPLSNNKPLII